MKNDNKKKHWDSVYSKLQSDEVSWYQAKPEISLDLLTQFKLSLSAGIIDIGGGDSLFVDHLLELGYTDLTVLDISEAAIGKARKRLGKQAEKVHWIVADAADFSSERKYDFWHDRAAFHFLTEDREVENYLAAAHRHLTPGGYLVLGTFSDQGPEKCSGLPVKRYSEDEMSERLQKYFAKISCISINHNTPSGNMQNFIFCSFRKEL